MGSPPSSGKPSWPDLRKRTNPNLDIQIYQSLKLGETAFKKRMAEVYSKLARDYPVLGQATKGKRELLQTILQAAFGAQTNAQT